MWYFIFGLLWLFVYFHLKQTKKLKNLQYAKHIRRIIQKRRQRSLLLVGGNQRIYLTLRTDSPSVRLPEEALSQPLSVLSACNILHYLSVCITAVIAGGERLGECFLQKTKGGSVRSKSDIYSLGDILECRTNNLAARMI